MNLVTDGLTILRRNLIQLKRVPDLILFTLFQPIMFIVLFGYVFGAAIGGGDGANYRSFLIAGIFAQTILFGSTITGSSLAEDMQKGIIDRFRTLPMAPSAVLLGRTLADLINNVLVLVIMSVTGLVVGWRITGGFWEAVAGFALMLGFAYAFSWVMAFLGLLVRTPEVLNNATFMVLFPLTFISNAFAPPEQFPSVLRAIAGWNPISTLTQSVRDLFGNNMPGLEPDRYTWALQHPIVYTLIWLVILVGVFAPLATLQYQRAGQR